MSAIGDYWGVSKILESSVELGYPRMMRTHTFAFDMSAFCIRTPDGEYQIKDPAKADGIAKTVACMQASWLIAQVIGRMVEHVAITPLEVATVTYVGCALISYVIWWEKPQNIAVPIVLKDWDDSTTKQEWIRSHYDHARDTWLEFVCAGNMLVQKGLITYHGIRIQAGKLMFSACIFGDIHLASWNIKLPTSVEDWVWRMSALGCLVLPMAIVLASFNSFTKLSTSFGPFAYAYFALYGVVRVFMLVEMFISLRLQPESIRLCPVARLTAPHIANNEELAKREDYVSSIEDGN
ncbi:uncharacterized protein KY384_004048 [Bacidia gigantensis]|uniref:uncharacterized protein n=1 Tax=Bacidia gigantensis TaxID=2732470 RepID=UPI001D0577E7|nr:uncharacterized protein KY384_004048 [Bacidia gigantensis]KAG8530693.1 hypothetical protein KY384_004048 [Bacidia gigantensis]